MWGTNYAWTSSPALFDDLVSKMVKVVGLLDQIERRCLRFWIANKWGGIKHGGGSKAVPLQAWTGPEGSRKLRFPDFVTTAQDGGRLSALCTGRLLPPGNTPGTRFC